MKFVGAIPCPPLHCWNNKLIMIHYKAMSTKYFYNLKHNQYSLMTVEAHLVT